jgi:hypothetical protein
MARLSRHIRYDLHSFQSTPFPFFPSFFQEDTIPGRPFDFTFDSPSSHSDGRMEEGDDT